MNQKNSKTRAEYRPPILEQQAVYVILTGVSLPVGTNILEGETE